MKPENELQADEVSFVNTCRQTAEHLLRFERGRYGFHVAVFDGEGKLAGLFGPGGFQEPAPEVSTEPLTLEEFDAIVRTGEAELPPTPSFVPAAVEDNAQQLEAAHPAEELLPHEVPLMVHGFPAQAAVDDTPRASLADAFGAVGLPEPPLFNIEPGDD